MSVPVPLNTLLDRHRLTICTLMDWSGQVTYQLYHTIVSCRVASCQPMAPRDPLCAKESYHNEGGLTRNFIKYSRVTFCVTLCRQNTLFANLLILLHLQVCRFPCRGVSHIKSHGKKRGYKAPLKGCYIPLCLVLLCHLYIGGRFILTRQRLNPY